VPSVLITGVSSGIGESTTRYLVERGLHIFGSVRKASDAEHLVDTLGDSFTTLVFDVRDTDSVRASVATVERKLAAESQVSLNGLINNAGIAALGSLECLSDERFETSLMINVVGTRNVINAFLPLLRGDAQSNAAPCPSPNILPNPLPTTSTRRKTRIINISSLSGIINTPITGAYCVSKHAMESLGEVYRRELYDQNIDVVSIRSGPVASKIWTKNSAETVPGGDHPLYRAMTRRAVKISENATTDAISGDVIAKLVFEILQGKKQKTHYELGKGATVSKLIRLLPTRLADRLISRAMRSD